jgi:methylmalonyl-CoA mutase N-terminal domain/subunit
MVRAIEAGYPQREIEQRAYEHQRAVERKERLVVGVNEQEMAEEAPIPVATLDPALEGDQVQRVRAVRARRDAAETARALQALDDAALGTANLVGPIVGAVKAMATVGEIADVLRARFGEHRPV